MGRWFVSSYARGVVACSLLALVSLAGADCGGGSPTYCAKACASDADCCPAQAVGCPGPYPQNYVCDSGLCRSPRCQVDSDCTFFASPACRPLHGLASCLAGCATDADCVAMGGLGGVWTCTGRADDGTPICAVALPACASDADCLGGGSHCRDGRCGCVSDTDCPAARSRCSARTCGCASDAQCGPGLDVCTTDPAFAYPPGSKAP